MTGFATNAVHGVKHAKDAHGSLRMPLYDCVAFENETSRDIQLSSEGKKPDHSYSRILNPTVEDKVKSINYPGLECSIFL